MAEDLAGAVQEGLERVFDATGQFGSRHKNVPEAIAAAVAAGIREAAPDLAKAIVNAQREAAKQQGHPAGGTGRAAAR